MSHQPRLPRVSREAAKRDARDLRLALGLTAEIEPYLAGMMSTDDEGMTGIPKATFAPNAESLVKSGVLVPMMVGRQPSGRFDVDRMRSVARSYRATRRLAQEGGPDAS
jgi:hypothetical protein